MNEVRSLNARKPALESDILTKIIKENEEFFFFFFFADFLQAAFNECIESGDFDLLLKWADVIRIFQKGQRSQKDNYRPASILPKISKLFERPLFKQMSSFFGKTFLMYQWGLSKKF